jgi:heat shock protein HtpX
MGFGGAFISLLISKPMAKWSTGAHVIDDAADPPTSSGSCDGAPLRREGGIGMPEVAIYRRGAQCFATGAFRGLLAGGGVDRGSCSR